MNQYVEYQQKFVMSSLWSIKEFYVFSSQDPLLTFNAGYH